MLKIKLVKESDAEVMRDLALESFAEDAEKYGSPPPQIDTLKWHHPEAYGGVYYKLIINEEIIGGLRLIDKGDSHYYFASVFIVPKHQNKGYGSQVMKFVDAEYPQVKKWTLDTPYQSYRNHYFYEKYGYKKVGEFKPDPKGDFVLFLYEKLL